MNKLRVKKQLYEYCIVQIQQKLDMVQSILNDAQESANKETKSTAGDKHDTARAMAHLETEKNAKQLSEINKLKKVLPYLKSTNGTILDKVQLGSIVETNNGNYYISANFGMIQIDNISYFTISPLSPIGKSLMGQKKGNKVNFNQQEITIIDVF